MDLLPPKRYLPIGQVYPMPGPYFRLGDPEAGSCRIEADRELAAYRVTKQGRKGQWNTSGHRRQFEERLRVWLNDAAHRDQPGLFPGKSLSLDKQVALIQEDVVLMHLPGKHGLAARSQAIYMNVSSPGGWCPDCFLGKSFLSIHAGVPVADKFDGAGRMDAAQRLFEPGDKVRFVWGLTPDDRLDRRVCRRTADGNSLHQSIVSSWDDGSRLWLRVERQVICPLNETISVFLIRVYRYSWDSLDVDTQARIRASIESMPASVRSYKGFDGAISLL